jgi:outer membrane protein TolC
VKLGETRFQLAQAQARLAGAEAGLARLIGQAGRVRAIDDSALYRRPLPTLDTAVIVAEALAPQVQAAQAKRTAAAASLRAAKMGYWPTLTLAASTTWDGSKTNNYQLLNQHQVSLQLTWNLFDRLNRETQITAQRSAYAVATATATDTERMLAATLITQVAQLDAARENVESIDASKAAAAENLEVQQERYRVGLSTIVDVLTSQEALTQAEVNAVTARFDYMRALVQIEAMIGRTF